MNKSLKEILQSEEDEIVYEVTQKLRYSSAPHYSGLETEDLRPEIKTLYRAFKGSIIKDEPNIWNSYITRVYSMRLDEGYDIEEVQFATNCLWKSIWDRVASLSPKEDLVQNLEVMAQKLSDSKDQLAKIIFDKGVKTQEELLKINLKFENYLRKKRADELRSV